MQFNDGYPNFENILHNDDDSSFNFIPCVSCNVCFKLTQDVMLYKIQEKYHFLEGKHFLFILYSHIGVRVCRSSTDDKGRLKRGYKNG